MAHIDILMITDVEGILQKYAPPSTLTAPSSGPGSLATPAVVDGSYVFFVTKKADAYAYNGNWQLDVSTGTESETDVDIVRWRWTSPSGGHKFDCPITGFQFGPSSTGAMETPRLCNYATTFIIADPDGVAKPVTQKGIDRCWESRATKSGTIGYNINFMIVDSEGNTRIHTQIDPYFVISS
ncbi:inclusion body family protein [Trinickia sp. LjRoot230]|uniref:AidA/PixA family protein n=1 Tax=Trinickia sp. LjRoot230 TaxID=3342288 RepID=UPI003ED11ACE